MTAGNLAIAVLSAVIDRRYSDLLQAIDAVSPGAP
jgi:hypothetical protein